MTPVPAEAVKSIRSAAEKWLKGGYGKISKTAGFMIGREPAVLLFVRERFFRRLPEVLSSCPKTVQGIA